LKAVWDDDALGSSLVSAENALSAATANNPFARLTVATARCSLLAAEPRINALFETATTPASTSTPRATDDVDPEDRKGKRPASHEDVPPISTHEPHDGWLANDGKFHTRHAVKARSL
jgi:hypothetical protein